MDNEIPGEYVLHPAGQSPKPASPSLGGMLFRSALRGIAFSFGMSVAGPIGGIAALALTSGMGGSDGIADVDVGI